MTPLIEVRNPPTSATAVSAFEQERGIIFPSSYRNFLSSTNGGTPFANEFTISGRLYDDVKSVHVFFGLGTKQPTSDLYYAVRLYDGAVPRDIIPIADYDNGDFVCLDLRKRKDAVVYWDHRHFWGTGEWREQDIYPVAPSFDVFLTMLRPATS